jgi:ribosomal protein RSM22 (predicted rRNA methylase)
MKVSKTPLERLFNSKGFSDLKVAVPELFTSEAIHEVEGDLRQTAISNAEDDKHKLFQMFYSPGTAVTYLAHRFPSTFGANFRVMTEILKRVPDFYPENILDYGSGPGASVLAAMQVWPSRTREESFGDDIPHSRKITCIEPSENMRKIAKYMLSDIENVEWQSALYDVSVGNKFDLIILSYVLMEIRDTDSRDLLIKNLYSKLAPGGILIILDCGTPTGFRFIHRIREQFIVNNPKDSWHIVAPCSHEGACPLAATGKDWCHFDQRILRLPHYLYSKGSRKNNIDLEKFSYLVVRKGVESPRAKYGHESLAPTSWEKSFFWPRVIMPAIKSGGHTLIDVCSPTGQFERLVVSKSKPHSFGYRFSRKIMWGDLWRYPRRLARKEARESYTPEQVKEHMDKLRETAENTKAQANTFKQEKQLDEMFYGQ